MTQTLSENRHAGEFLVSEANGTRSREVGTVAAGQTLKAGTVVSIVSTKLVASTAANENTIAGVLLRDWDASSDGPDGNADKKGQVYIARAAEVDPALLIFPSNIGDAVTAALLAKKIIMHTALEDSSESESASA